MGKLKPVVKKARVFVVRKNTRRIAELKRKKGSEQQLLKNQRKIQRLIKEIEELKDVNLDSFCEELLQQSSDVGPARVSFDMDTAAGRVRQKMCDTKVLQGALADHCAEERRATLGKKQKEPVHLPKNSKSVSQSTGQRSRLGESSDDRDTSATQLGTSIGDLDVEEASPLSCDSNSDEDVHMEPQTKLQSTREAKGHRKTANRLGQRARQRLWFGRYGQKANHLKREKSGRRTSELERRHLKGAQGESRAHQPGGGASTVTRPLSQELHPSWAAKKKQKEQSSSIDGFCGKKITFSDSD